MNVTLKQVRAFLAVAQHGSFTRAAQVLHVSQPALTVQIRELERCIGFSLFDRTTRSIHLTTSGRELAESFRQVVSNFDDVLAYASTLVRKERALLKVACIPSLAGTVLAEVIAAHRITNPDIEVKVRDLGWSAVQQAVRAGEVCIGIGAAESSSSDLVTTPLMEDKLHVVFPPGHPLQNLPEVTLETVSRYALILTNASSSLRNTIEFHFKHRGLILLLAHDVAQFSSAIGLVRAGIGITILPTTAVELSACDDLGSREIVDTTRKIILLTSPRVPMSNACVEFADLLSNAFSDLQDRMMKARDKFARNLPTPGPGGQPP
jgi:DNA-binding transcriptional LysR family regulator